MAIIVDPDLLDRNEVIYGPVPQEISLYPVAASPKVGSPSHLGNTASGTRFFTAESGTPFANAVAGDILLVKSGADAGHFIIEAVNDSANVNISVTHATFSTTEAALAFEVRANVGGAIADGVTEQCVYSFSKEEWRSDSQANVGGILITGNIQSANASVANISPGTTGLFAGQRLVANNIPANSFIVSVTDGTTVLLNNTASGTDAAAELIFSIDSDDLIRHPFPFEPITAEQFEIGGGAAHEDWNWFNDYTIKKVRTGGWAIANTAAATILEYTGIVTLGALDADAQVYYQQNSAVETPVDFTFLGPVNEAIFTWDVGGDDRRTYLKLFARKKARSYAQSEISDIGVTQIQTIVNRFPLAHALDTAITTPDAEILGTAITRDTTALTQGNLWAGTDGNTTTGTTQFDSGGSAFLGNVEIGDTLHIVGGNVAGYYTIGNVDSDTVLQIATDAEFTTWPSTESNETWYIFTNEYIIGAANARVLTNAVLTNIDSLTGNLVSATATFVTANVQTGDMVLISEGTDVDGAYKIANVVSQTELTLNTSDNVFAGETAINYQVVRKGMYLQYKKEEVTLAAVGNLTFADANPDTIARSSGSWSGDGVTAGDTIVISGTTLNDGSYTVATPGTTTMTLVATDSVVTEDIAANANVYTPFKRTINNVVYGFNWRLFGVGALALDCFEFVQHQLRQTTDIDHGPGTSRGDITDLLMTYASPTGATINMIIDDINNDDLNNVTYEDATGTDRVFPFSSSITLAFNVNLQNDTNAKFWVFFTNDDAGDNTGRDYGTKDALIVQDSSGNLVTGNVGAAPSFQFTYDYDGNTQRGGASAGVNAPVTIIAIGLDTAQFVITTGTITRSKGINISLVSALERNYLNA